MTIIAVYPCALVYDGLFAEYFRTWPPAARTMVFSLVPAPLLTYAPGTLSSR
ncbi:hypothetical protein [Streptomyces sp. E2N166]|uniref:hypothetical protein n=1 Tax=Streptomyces sp. E2N166 TaxID=1851909 RepID=UPI001EE82F92|nr:hypothetical protein [Streptomyces sp. E2N166]